MVLTGTAAHTGRRSKTGFKFQVVRKAEGTRYITFPGNPESKLIPYKGLVFQTQEFSDRIFEFVLEDGRVTALKHTSPSGEYLSTRK